MTLNKSHMSGSTVTLWKYAEAMDSADALFHI